MSVRFVQSFERMSRQPHIPTLFILSGGIILLGAGLLAQTGSTPAALQPAPGPADRTETPRLLADINPSGSSDPGGFVRAGRAIYFRANDGTHGAELWRTDGTAEGTSLVADINIGDGASTPDGIKAFGGRIFFAASTPETGREVWVSDGTADGTSLLHDINPAAADALPTAFVRLRDALYFRAQDGATDLELWKTQGTAETTARVADLHPGAEGSIPTFPIAFRGALFFAADNAFVPGVGFDRELWRTDGTEAGTTRVKDINPGPPPSIPGEIMRLGNLLIFKAGTAAEGGELWRSDGTEAGTTMVADMNPGSGSSFPTNLVRVGRVIYFAANDGQTGRELWRTDGTEAGTRRVADINPGAADSSPINGIAFRGGYLFNAGDVEHGRELWFSDGTEAGTRLVKDINPGPALSGPLEITAVGRLAFFSIVKPSDAGDNTVLTELWRTDGTEAGTTRVWQAPGRLNGYAIRDLTSVGGALLFSAPTRTDANGLAIDFEPYVLSVRGPRDSSDLSTSSSTSSTTTNTTSSNSSGRWLTTDAGNALGDDDRGGEGSDDGDDAAIETPATVDEAGLPIERAAGRADAGSAEGRGRANGQVNERSATRSPERVPAGSPARQPEGHK